MILLIPPKIKYISCDMIYQQNVLIWSSSLVMMKGDFCVMLSSTPSTMNLCSAFLMDLCTLFSCMLTHVWSWHALSCLSMAFTLSDKIRWKPSRFQRKGCLADIKGPAETCPFSMASSMFLETSFGFLKWIDDQKD